MKKLRLLTLIVLLLGMGLTACAEPVSDGALPPAQIPQIDVQNAGDMDEQTAEPEPEPTPDTRPERTPAPTPPPVPTPEVIMPFNMEIDAFTLARNMGAGWNLGNTLDARLAPSALPLISAQEIAWGNPLTTREMINLVADTGFSSLRLPITWDRFIGPAPDYIIDDAILDRVQTLVDYGIEAGLYVIINTHHESWNFPSAENREAALIHAAIWRQIGGRFAGYSERLIFESMNEPRMFDTPHEWTGGTAEARNVINGWNHIFIQTIRDTGYNNEHRFLMIPTIAASGDAVAVDDMWIPSDERVLISIHSYTPFDLVLNTRSARRTFDPNLPSDTEDIDALFERLYNRFISQGTAVVMGEMGAINKDENIAYRAAWAEYYTAVAASLGIPCFWWDNGIRVYYRTGAEAFGLMNRRDLTWDYPEIVEAMLVNFR